MTLKNKIMYVMGGNVLTSELVTKNVRFIAVLFVISFLFITHKYAYVHSLTKNEDLKRELKHVKYKSLTLSSQLMSNSRSIKVEKLVKSKGVEVEMNKARLYKVK